MVRLFFFGTFILSCFVWILLYHDTNSFISYTTEYVPASQNQQTPNTDSDTKYLVSSPKCKILDLEPFNEDAKKFFHLEKYAPCRNLELLTYVTKTDNTTILHVDDEILPSYLTKKSKKGISCCYSNVTRSLDWRNPDDDVRLSKCTKFTNNVTVHSEVITVKCTDPSTKKQVYENAHAIIKLKENVQKKIETFDNSTKPLSILIVGIDSISRLNFIRNLPNTYKYVTDNEWATLKGYNKMDDNTFPNLMAILTGYNQSYSYLKCNPKELGHLDRCPLLWYDFRKLGYITGYAEDEGKINTFNYRKKGFISPPVDYYFRPYVLASEKLKIVRKDEMTYCTGPETSGERIFNVAKDFSITFKDYPQFGLFWMNSFSHNIISSPSRLDNKIKQFLDDLKSSGVLDNVIVIFLSDHGIRFGDIRLTPTGWLEERLPFIFISFPKWFREKYSQEYSNFLANEDKLTSPYDLHMTLQHILVLSSHNYSVKPSDACPTCRSLFQKIDQDRSCEEAGIEQHWCTCSGYKEVDLNQQVAKSVAEFVINRITDIIHKHHSDGKCAKYTFNKLISLSLSEKLSYKNDTYILIRFETKPKAVFESTVLYKGKIEDKNFYLGDSISRLDSYRAHSKCVSDAYLQKYCYCR